MGDLKSIIDNIENIPYERLVDPTVVAELTQHAIDTRDHNLYGRFIIRTGFEPQSDIEVELLQTYHDEREIAAYQAERRAAMPFRKAISLANSEYVPETVTGIKNRLRELREAGAKIIKDDYNAMDSVELRIYYHDIISQLKEVKH